MTTLKNVIGELSDKRSETNKTFLLSDGSYKSVFFSTPQHYVCTNGHWYNIDTKLFDEADADVITEPVSQQCVSRLEKNIKEARTAKNKSILNRENFGFQTLKTPFDCHIPRNFSKGYTIAKDDDILTFFPVDASSTLAEVEGNIATYQDAWNDTDVELEVQPDGLKETIIVKSEDAPTTFRFEIRGSDISDNFEAGKLKIDDAFLVDAEGIKRYIEMEIVRKNRKTYLVFNCDFKDLHFPIKIDPTVRMTTEDTWTTPNGVGHVKFDIQGGAGHSTSSANRGGRGARILYETQNLTGGKTFAISFIDGGRGGVSPGGSSIYGADGGKATVIRENDQSGTILFVASGGGGSGGNYGGSTSERGGRGGDGGSVGEDGARANSSNGGYGGGGARRDRGGSGGDVGGESGGFLRAGDGGDGPSSFYAGGGGGGAGYYGGGGGGTNRNARYGGGGGGGGSSYRRETDATIMDGYNDSTSPFVEITYNLKPTPPTVTSPNGGERWNAEHLIEWERGTDPDGDDSLLRYQILLSVNGGITWKTIVPLTEPGATSYEYDFTNEPHTDLALIRIRAFDGDDYSEWDESDGVFSINHNLAPLQPTNLSPNGTVVARGDDNVFSWQFNDPNEEDVQSSFSLRWRPSGGNWTFIEESTPNEYTTIPGNTFPRGNIEWQVRTFDQEGLDSPWSNTATFFAGDKPAKPVILQPTESVGVANPTVQWSSSGQVAYRLKLEYDGDVVYTHEGGMNKAHTIQYDLENNTTYTVKLAIQNDDELWSDEDVVEFYVSYTPPAVPTLNVNVEDGFISLVVDNPTPTQTQPTVTHYDVYRDGIRIAKNVPTDVVYKDYPNGDVKYRVRVWGDNNTYTDSITEYANLQIKRIWLHDINDPDSLYQFKYFEIGRQASNDQDGSLLEFEGRELPMVTFSDREEKTIDFTLQILDEEDMKKLREFVKRRSTLLYRDYKGRRIHCVIFSVQENEEVWGYTVPVILHAVYVDEEV